MTKLKSWVVAGSLSVLAIPSFGAPVDAAYIFSYDKANLGQPSQNVGLEMDVANKTTSLIWGDRVHTFDKRPTFVEIPLGAQKSTPAVDRLPAFQVELGTTNHFLTIFEDGVVVNVTDVTSPYIFKLPELAGRYHFKVYRGTSDFSDLFVVLENRDLGTFYAIFAGFIYRIEKSVKFEILAGKRIQPMVNGNHNDWNVLLVDKKVHCGMQRVGEETGYASRQLDPQELLRWNKQVDILQGRATPSLQTQKPFPSKVELIDHALLRGRYNVVQHVDKLEIWDDQQNSKIIAEIPLLDADFKLSSTGAQLLIYYPTENRTDAFEIGDFGHLGTYSTCAAELVAATGLKPLRPKPAHPDPSKRRQKKS